jgi:hypothetical protein
MAPKSSPAATAPPSASEMTRIPGEKSKASGNRQREPEALEQRCCQPTEGRAGGASGGEEEERLDEQQAGETRPTGSQSLAHTELLLPRERPRQEQPRRVDSRDRQDETGQAGQDGEERQGTVAQGVFEARDGAQVVADAPLGLGIRERMPRRDDFHSFARLF